MAVKPEPGYRLELTWKTISEHSPLWFLRQRTCEICTGVWGTPAALVDDFNLCRILYHCSPENHDAYYDGFLTALGASRSARALRRAGRARP